MTHTPAEREALEAKLREMTSRHADIVAKYKMVKDELAALRQPAAPVGYTREDMLALLKHVLPDNDVFGRPFRSNHETIIDAFLASRNVQP